MPKEKNRTSAIVAWLEEKLSEGVLTSRSQLFDAEFFTFGADGSSPARARELRLKQLALCKNPATEAYAVIYKCKFYWYLLQRIFIFFFNH